MRGAGEPEDKAENPEKNAMHVQGMLLAFLGMSTWYLHETCMCHACFMHSVQHAYDHYACFWPPCMLHSQHVRNLHSIHACFMQVLCSVQHACSCVAM